MRKQMKVAAVVSAAALLALGASITSFAAKRGTWKYEDGEWYCYDSNGDVYENEFCLSNGKEFYVGDDGMMVRSSWVEDDGDYYFVNSAGQKITNDWRLTTPYDDEEGEEQWFYFQSNGERVEDKKLLIKGKTYFFDDEGKMLTGWVQGDGDSWDEASTTVESNSNTYYCDETGARLEKAWVYDYAPDVDRDEPGSDDEEHYFYLKSSGKAATGKQSNIKGQTYFFDEEGKMLYGWVAKTGSDAYEMVWEDDEDEDGTYDISLADLGTEDIYYCGDDEFDGHMKKDKWVKLWSNEQFGEEDDDNDRYWYYVQKNGKIYVPSASDYIAYADRYSFEDGEASTFDTVYDDDNYDDANFAVAEKKVNGKTYLFDAKGRMLSGFVKFNEVIDPEDQWAMTGNLYYYGDWDDGEREDGSVSLSDDSGESYRFYFATENKYEQGYFNAAAINGAKSGKLYRNGLLVKADDYKYEEIDGITIKWLDDKTQKEADFKFIVNKSGSIQHNDKEYEDDDDVVVDATGYKFITAKGAMYNAVDEGQMTE